MTEITSAEHHFRKRIVCDVCHREIKDITTGVVVWPEELANGSAPADYKTVHRGEECDPRGSYVYWEPLVIFLDGLNELNVPHV
jgi:hypothetical protein